LNAFRAKIHHHGAGRAFCSSFACCQQRHGHALFVRNNAAAFHLPNKHAAHFARRVRPERRGALSRVVVGFVAHELAILVRREPHAEVDELRNARADSAASMSARSPCMPPFAKNDSASATGESSWLPYMPSL